MATEPYGDSGNSYSPVSPTSSDVGAIDPLSGGGGLGEGVQPQPEDALAGTGLISRANAPTQGGMAPESLPSAANNQASKSPWQAILMGALAGLSGAAGQRGRQSFGTGLAAGAQSELANIQQQKENQMRQQQLQFESVKAADSHIMALDQHTRAEQLTAASKLDYKQKSAEYQQFLQDNFGIAPDLSFNDSNTEAQAGMQTLASRNNGAIPPIATLQQPESSGTHGQISVYSPTQQQMQQNSAGYRNLVNTQRAVLGQPSVDDRSWNSIGFKGQRDAAQQALQFLSPVQAFTKDNLPVVLAQREQQLAIYKQHKDENGKPDADPAMVQQLQAGVSYLKNAQQSMTQTENEQAVSKINATAGPEAQAAGLKAAAQARAQQPFKQAQARFEESLKDGDPNSAGQLLVSGFLAPSQLLSTRKPAFAQQAFDAARKMSPKWNAQVAEAQYKYATNPATQNTLNMIDAMNDPGGSLEIAEKAFREIPFKMADQDWNKFVNGKLDKYGGKSIVKFRTALLGFADEYSKVIGGGTPTDTGRQQSLDLLKEAYSKGQANAAINIIHQDIAARKRATVRNNPALMLMYPDNSGAGTSTNKPFDPASEFIPIPTH